MTDIMTETAPTRKTKAFFAQYQEIPGIVTQVDGHLIFLDTETNAVTPITPANAMQVLILDAVEHWVEQYYADLQAARLERTALAA